MIDRSTPGKMPITGGRAIENELPVEPNAKWIPEKVSQGYVGDYKPFSLVDGEGVRCAVFFSGCLLKCPGCFNEEVQSFKYGHPYTQELEEKIIKDLEKPYVQGLSLIGGEPFLNTPTALQLVRRVKTELPAKDIWAWTGFTFDYLNKFGNESQKELLANVDVLIDGPFLVRKKNLSIAFRGSDNQRIIDVPMSLKTDELKVIAKFDE